MQWTLTTLLGKAMIKMHKCPHTHTEVKESAAGTHALTLALGVGEAAAGGDHLHPFSCVQTIKGQIKTWSSAWNI